MKYILSSAIALLMFSGCYSTYEQPVSYEKYVLKNVRASEYKKPYADTDNIHQDLNGAIVAIADQLLTTNVSAVKNTSIILTSFADLNKLNKTTTFGRILGESMFNELHIRKFKVTDFRGQDAISVNGDGEFLITRDIERLRDHIDATEYVVVGTYVKFEYGAVLINARILDSESGAIISTARVIYKPADCSLFDICPKKKVNVKPPNYGIDIVTDNCSKVTCPTQNCKDGICDNSTLY